jgi:hypothetical protein
MQLPSGSVLWKRIQALQDNGVIDAVIAKRLTEENQADEANRATESGFASSRPHHSVQLFEISREQHLHASTDDANTEVDDQSF